MTSLLFSGLFGKTMVVLRENDSEKQIIITKDKCKVPGELLFAGKNSIT